jgi:hypothetical protein
MNSLIYLLEYNYGANGTIWSIYDINQWIVPYWRIYVKSSKKSIWIRRHWILTWFITCGLILTKKELSVATLMKSKRDEVATITLCKLKLKKYILYLILSIGMSLYQERWYIDCQQSLMLNKRLNTQVRWVKHNCHTHSTSHWTKENRMVRFPKPEGPIWADELQRLVS